MPRISRKIPIENGDKEARINTEITILSKSYARLTGHRKTLSERLIKRAATILILIEDLEMALLKDGCVDDYNNGAAQSGKKQSAEAQTFSSFSKQYSTYIKQLDDMLPEPQAEPPHDELAKFLMQKTVVTR